MIPYDLILRPDPRDPTQPKKYYASTHNIKIDNYRSLVADIADRSIISQPDVMAVLEGLFLIMHRYLEQGRVIRLGDLGSFKVTLQSQGVEKEEDAGPHMVKRARVRFTEGKVLKKAMRNVEYKKFGDDIA